MDLRRVLISPAARGSPGCPFAEGPGQVAGGRLQGRLGHPIQSWPGQATRASKSSHDRAALGHQRYDRVGHRPQRYGGDLHRDRHVVPGGLEAAPRHASARTRWRGGRRRPGPQRSAGRRTAAGWVASVTSSSSTSGSTGSFRAVLGEPQAPAGARETTSAPSSWAGGPPEGERGVGQHAGEESRLPSRRPMPATPTTMRDAWREGPPVTSPVKIGVLGGTGPAGPGPRPARVRQVRRRHRVPFAVPGHGGRDRLLEQWSERNPPSSPEDNEGAAGADVVVIATPWDAAASTATSVSGSCGEGGDLDGQRPRQGRPRVPALVPPRAARWPRACGRGAEVARVGAFHHIAREGAGRPQRPVVSDVLICSDHPSATETTVEIVRLPDITPSADELSARPIGPSRAVLLAERARATRPGRWLRHQK